MMENVFSYPEQKEELEQYIADNQPCHVWHDKDVMRVYTGEDIPQQTKVIGE